jgi:uncharacterized Rmd1/YagE family protein
MDNLPTAEMPDPPKPLIDRATFLARAVLLGQRLDLSAISPGERLPDQPLMISVEGGGIAAVFRYGVVVLFDVAAAAERKLLVRLEGVVRGPAFSKETEELQIAIAPEAREGMDGDRLVLNAADGHRLRLVAAVLSKSVVLADYESLVADTFDHVEPLAVDLQREGRARRGAKRLMRYIGQSLLSQHRMVGRVEIRDKPDLLWEHPELEPLYVRLTDELEIGERHSIIDRKLDLISRTATTALELLHTRQGHRLEWYIVILILIEIVLLVYELFVLG